MLKRILHNWKFLRILSNCYNVQIRTVNHQCGTAKRYRILHFSDFHIGNFDVEHVEYIVELINMQKVDFVVFTGDIVCDRHTELTAPILVALSKIRHTVYAILGNHDYDLYTLDTKRERVKSFRTVLQKLTNIGWVYLINEWTSYEELLIVGTDDQGDDKWSMSRGNIDRAYEGAPREMPAIVLTHNPTYADEISREYQPQLILCGHTHAGQIGWNFKLLGRQWSWSLASKYKYWLDGYRMSGGLTKIWVNRGIVYDILPLRSFAPEITIHEIN